MRLSVFFALTMVGAALLPANPPDAKEDLHSDVPKVRAKAAEELGKDRDSQNIPLLRGLLKDPDRQVRAEAVAAIVNISTQDSLAPLMEATRD